MSPSPQLLQQFRTQLDKIVELTNEQWAIFSEYLYVREIPKKGLFAEAGKYCREVALIARGSMRVFHVKDGVEMSGYFCFQNEFVSSYTAFLRGNKSSISIDAMEDAVLICFTHQSLQSMLADDRIALKMERFGRLIAEELICCYDERVISFITMTPEERYMLMVERQDKFLQKVPQHYIANYLGITPVSLSRIRKRILAEAGKRRLAS